MENNIKGSDYNVGVSSNSNNNNNIKNIVLTLVYSFVYPVCCVLKGIESQTSGLWQRWNKNIYDIEQKFSLL